MASKEDLDLLSLLPKPFKDTDSLFRGLLEAIKTYGILTHPGAVFRTVFTMSEDLVLGAEHAWVVEAKIEGYGSLTAAETSLASLDEAQKLEELHATPVMTQSWKVSGQTLKDAADQLRSKLAQELSALAGAKRDEAQRATDALNQLHAGSEGGVGAIWQEDPVAAEAAMEAIVDHTETAVSPSTVEHPPDLS